jgi:hypothetical protein
MRWAPLARAPPALADVTPAAVAELALEPGSQVWLAVKATDLEVYSRDPLSAAGARESEPDKPADYQ